MRSETPTDFRHDNRETNPFHRPSVKRESIQLVYELWDELAAFPAGNMDAALDHLMGWFQKRLKVDNVIWLGSLLMLDEEAARKDPLLGWRLRARRSMVLESESYRKLVASYFANEHYGKRTSAFYRKGNRPDADIHIGMASRAVTKGAGRFRVHRMRDGWIDYAAFRQTEHYRLYYIEPGIADRIWAILPLSPTVESFFLLDRYQPQNDQCRHFTREEADIAALALRGIGEFHRRLFLTYGLLGDDKALSPIEREIIRHLLTDMAEKEIAAAMGQKLQTTHKYITSLYTRFGVKGRTGLMALWLGSKERGE